MKPAFRLGLGGRLILLLLAAFAALASVIVAQSLHDRSDHVAAASEQLLGQAKLIAARQQSITARGDALLSSLMPHPELHAAGAADACPRLYPAMLKQQTEFINIGMVLPDGALVCSAVPAAGHITFADRPWFQQALQTREMVIGDVVTGRIVGQPVFNFGKAMRNDAGRVTGVLFVALDIAWLERQLTKEHLPQGARLMVVDDQGRVAVRQPDPEGWVGRSIAHLSLFKHIQTDGGEGTLEETGLDGVRRLYAHASLLATASGRKYHLWLGVPRTVVVAPARRDLAVNLALSLLIFAGALALVVVGGNRLVLRPLLALSRVAARFKAGDLTARSGLPHTDDEVGQLARTLDETADAIEDKECKLARANRALRVLSAGNRALLRAKGEQELAVEMCRALVEAGGYRIAWVAQAKHDLARSVRNVAAWGAERDFLDSLKITWDETESGRGPTGTAIRRGIPIVSNDIAADPDYGPWRERAQRYGYASSLALPLRIDGAVMGALNLYAAEPDAFDAEEVKLLGEAADDLASGIATQRGEAEHARTQAALKAAEDIFRAAADASLDALFILHSVRGADGRITDFEVADLNVRAEQMLGMAREQAIGHKLGELLPWVRTQGRLDPYAAVASTGVSLDEEFAVNVPEIKAKWLRQQAVRLNDGLALFMRDVTSWKEAGAALKESEAKHRLLIESLQEGIWMIDKDANTSFVNLRMAQMLGYSVEEMQGRHLFSFMDERGKEVATQKLECRKQGIIEQHDFEFLRKDGRRLYTLIATSPILDEAGNYAGAIAGVTDITARKQQEAQIINLNRALRTLSDCNVALVHAQSEEELFQTVCRHIVEAGGYRLAFIGFAGDDAEKTVSIVAQHGAEAGYLESLGFTWADTDKGQGTVGRAIRSGAPQVSQNIMADPKLAAWRGAAARLGSRASISLPLNGGDGKAFGVLTICAAETDAFDAGEIELLTELADDIVFGMAALRTRAERDRIAYQHLHHAEILQKSLEQSIRAIADTVEARDPYTAGHQRRVSELAVAIARELGLPEETIHGIQLAATIHDLGKIHIPAEYLSKSGKLTDIEFMIIKTHPQAGYDILKGIEFPWPIADIVRQHHERLDGSGYPQGLKDEQILLESRILAVADVVEAMASHRPYRPTLGIEVALQEIERGRGRAYDPAVADACLKLFREGRFAFQG